MICTYFKIIIIMITIIITTISYSFEIIRTNACGENEKATSWMIFCYSRGVIKYYCLLQHHQYDGL